MEAWRPWPLGGKRKNLVQRKNRSTDLTPTGPSHGRPGIPSDRPGAGNFQQPLNYGSMPRSFNRISPCYHVHLPKKSATKACLCYVFHCTNPELGHIRRKPRLTSEAKALISKTRQGGFGLFMLHQVRVHQISKLTLYRYFTHGPAKRRTNSASLCYGLVATF